MAAASGSSIRKASLAPAFSAASRTARFSTERHARGDADHHLRLEQPEPMPDLVDDVAQHRLGDQVVGDHAVAHRPDGPDVAGGAPDHLARLLADGDELVVVLADGDDARLVEHHALALDVHQDVGGAEVDADLHARAIGPCCWSWGGASKRRVAEYTEPASPPDPVPPSLVGRAQSSAMPEGDTIFRTASVLRAALVGRRVVNARAQAGPGLRRVPDLSRVMGSVVTSVEARGKHLLIGFDNGLTLRSHMRMRGSWHRYRPRRGMEAAQVPGERDPRDARGRRRSIQHADARAPDRCRPAAVTPAARARPRPARRGIRFGRGRAAPPRARRRRTR